jgi:hypothetical protein
MVAGKKEFIGRENQKGIKSAMKKMKEKQRYFKEWYKK